MKLVGLLLLLAALPSDLFAQEFRHRKGFRFGAGVGIGNLQVSCPSCPYPQSGLASRVTLRAGVTLSSHVLLGIDYDRTQSQRTTDAVRSYRLTTSIYPWSGHGLFLSAGFGTAAFDSNDPHAPDADFVGIGAGFGMGYDLRFSRLISLTPAFTMLYGRQSRGNGPVSETAIAFSLGLTFN